MADKTYQIAVDATAYVTHTLTLTLPDGLTEDEVSKRIGDAVDGIDWDDVLDGADVDTTAGELSPAYEYAPRPPPQPVPVPGDAWIEWRGRRWATDGYVIVRDDCPPMVHIRKHTEWRTPGSHYGRPSPADLDKLFPSPTTPPGSVGPAPIVNLHAEPLVRAAAAVAWGGSHDPIWLLDAAGEMMAIVMPMDRALEKPEDGEDVDVMFRRTRGVPS